MDLVYNSFAGAYSDSPRAVFERLRDEPGHRHVWLAGERHAAAFPPGVETVPYGSPEAVAALEAADVVLANTHTDFEWSKGPRTLYLQIWHGTPLKRVHRDILWSPPGLLDRLQRDVDRWDVLVSPNRASTPRLRQAFGYEGEVLEIGYPRNDVLSAPDREQRRAQVRGRLEIPDGATAVLYTPTFRDDAVFADRSFELGLDAAAFADALGGDHVLLLRLHYMVTERLPPMAHPAVRDVSLHLDVSELYLAADVLVTDYSSTMFDFAVTGKPILYLTYDLEYFQNELRGFYFDFEATAPGPLLRTSDAVADALRDLDKVQAEYARRYEEFAATYCEFDDGRAAARVVDRVFAEVAVPSGA
ncbi:MAG: CDP-glycerol glycerophosphotransferase [Solirubrobacteraceae bacterium]|nr:CDP-glycerol glycerophosphotransferase [Solirubrobacteraceae bacterium]